MHTPESPSSRLLSPQDRTHLHALFLAWLEQSSMFSWYLHLFLVPEAYRVGEYVFDANRVDGYVRIFFSLLDQGYFPAYVSDPHWIRSRSVESSHVAFAHKSDPVMSDFLDALSLLGRRAWCEIPVTGDSEDFLSPDHYADMVRSKLREMRFSLIEWFPEGSLSESDEKSAAHVAQRIDADIRNVLDSEH